MKHNNDQNSELTSFRRWLRTRLGDSRGAVAHEANVPLTPGSAFHVTVPTTAKGHLGTYTVTAHAKGLAKIAPTKATGTFQVEAYRAPEFAVTATTDRAHLFSTDKFEAELRGDYLFGAPMRGADSNWYLRAQRTSFYPKGFAGYSFSLPQEDAPSYGSVELTRGSGKLDSEGKLGVAVDLKKEWGSGTRTLQLSAEVVDANRQSVASNASA